MSLKKGFEFESSQASVIVAIATEVREGERSREGERERGVTRSHDDDDGDEKRRKKMELLVVLCFCWGVGRMGPMSTSAVQQLYDACKAAFCGGGGASDLPSSPIALERVRLALENITSLDVGLGEEEQQQHEELDLGFFGSNDGETDPDLSMVVKCPSLPISYLPLYECEQFAMGIFCLPTSAVLPLHNHPGMTVLSKVLYGSVHVRAYDWVNPFDEMLNADPSRRRLAKRQVDHVLTAPCKTSVLYPTTGGNIHAFTALTPCALFDVLAPPYSRASGRNCTYYHIIPKAVFPVETEELQVDGDTAINDSCYDWLEGFEPPKDFKVERVEYRGLKVAL